MGSSTDGEITFGFVLDDGEDNDFFEEKDIYELVEKEKLELVNYCSGDYPMYLIGIKESHKSCYRGGPEEIEESHFKHKEEWVTKLKEFMEKYKIPDRRIGWYLTSYWG